MVGFEPTTSRAVADSVINIPVEGLDSSKHDFNFDVYCKASIKWVIDSFVHVAEIRACNGFSISKRRGFS